MNTIFCIPNAHTRDIIRQIPWKLNDIKIKFKVNTISNSDVGKQ